MQGIADYEFVRYLGQGNNGEFYLAHKPARLPVDAEFVAVKVLSGPVTEDVFRRATRELTAFAAVRSPNIVTLYDAGQQGGVFFYSMEYLAGGSLAEPAAPLTEQQRRRAIEDAARAAHALHEGGIVHGDVKPANVLLFEGGGKLSDLGLSRVVAPGMTLTGMGQLSSVEYTDPRLLRGADPSRSSDVYSLAATAHRALTGRGLFGDVPENDPILALRAVLSREPTVAPELDRATADLLRGAIADDPALRPATAWDFAERFAAASS